MTMFKLLNDHMLIYGYFVSSRLLHVEQDDAIIKLIKVITERPAY